jgi:hypothetical protein
MFALGHEPNLISFAVMSVAGPKADGGDERMIRTKTLALGAAVLVGALSSVTASAGELPQAYWGAAPGFVAEGSIGPRNPYDALRYNGYFGEPSLYSSYHGDGSCFFVRHRVSTPYGPRFRLTQICG